MLAGFGILDGAGALGDMSFGVGNENMEGAPGAGDDANGEGLPSVAFAIMLFRSDRELRRFFFCAFSDSIFSVGGEPPMVLSLDIKPLELVGRSSKAPSTVGLSRDAGRRFGDSIDFDRFTDVPFERLDGFDSVGTGLRVFLLSVLQTEERSSL